MPVGYHFGNEKEIPPWEVLGTRLSEGGIIWGALNPKTLIFRLLLPRAEIPFFSQDFIYFAGCCSQLSRLIGCHLSQPGAFFSHILRISLDITLPYKHLGRHIQISLDDVPS